jgi:hypothetical protein
MRQFCFTSFKTIFVMADILSWDSAPLHCFMICRNIVGTALSMSFRIPNWQLYCLLLALLLGRQATRFSHCTHCSPRGVCNRWGGGMGLPCAAAGTDMRWVWLEEKSLPDAVLGAVYDFPCCGGEVPVRPPTSGSSMSILTLLCPSPFASCAGDRPHTV